MEDELRELRELVAQLKADNLKLRQEQAQASVPGPSSDHVPEFPAATPSVSAGVAVAERFVLVPRDRKCPKFNGRSGLGINEWVEEVQACIRARHLSTADQSFFLFDHLEGEAREEIRYRPASEREDPDKIIAALRELYGDTQSYVSLQEAFFSRRQQEGETLLEFSLVLMGLLERVKQRSPVMLSNAETLLRDQFVENVLDSTLRRELKQLVRRQPEVTLLHVRSEAIRWEREGLPGGTRSRSHSVPLAHGFQYGVQSSAPSRVDQPSPSVEMSELREMLKLQQEQLTRLTQSVAQLQNPSRSVRAVGGPVTCRRCQKPGHFARDCDGERVPPRSPSVTRPNNRALVGAFPRSGAESGN
ncbi:uncharacterized protein LOC113094613 [Carassius auratus]|uniref:Uncharacterized protein LOC113094613 n=1 Tax=Carassius auratus TaxID=7957 RepID=A0A6P6P4T5_CARAU|nr:uncharacterized protein LOC113094613 [Carassius auratus]